MVSGATRAPRCFFFPAHFSMRRCRLEKANFHTNITLYNLHILNMFENGFRYDDVLQNILKTTTTWSIFIRDMTVKNNSN